MQVCPSIQRLTGIQSDSNGGYKFSNPFLLESDNYMPNKVSSAYDLALFLSSLNPRFINALQTKFAFFITDIEVNQETMSGKESKDYKDFLRNQIGLYNLMGEVAKSWSVYGNAYIVPYLPFSRYLKIGSNYFDVNHLIMSNVPVVFRNDGGHVYFEVTIGGAKHKATFVDKPTNAYHDVRFRVVPPQNIHLVHNPVSGTTRYVYDLEASLRSGIKRCIGERLSASNAHIINETPIEMLRAVVSDKDFMFSSDFIYHFRLPSTAGLVENGMGIPPVIEHFRPLYNIQVYRKIDEAVGLDYMLPFRIFSPASGTNMQDILQQHNLSNWRNAVSSVIKSRRKDKFAMHSLPFPVTYQEFGANGKQLTPKDLKEFEQNDLMQSINFPPELFNGSISWQAAPMALRLFESVNVSIHHELYRFCEWVSDRVCFFGRKDKVGVSLQRPSIADNMERRQALLQMMQMGEISRSTALESFGINDPVAEGVSRMDEDISLQKERARKEQELQREMQAGVFDTGDGQGGGQGGGQGVTPQDLNDQAVALAEQWLAMPSDGQRSQAMQMVKAQDEQMYSLAKQKMEEIRRAGESQGRQQTAQAYQEAPG